MLSALAVKAIEHEPEAADTLVAIAFELTFLRGAVGRVLFDPHDFEDALQETLLAISRSLPSFDPARSFVGWACGIANNKAVDVLRRRGSTVVTDLSNEHRLPEVERFSSTLASRVDIAVMLDELSPKLGEVVRLRDVEHLSYQEIADVIGIGVNTVRSRLARGRANAQLLMNPLA